MVCLRTGHWLRPEGEGVALILAQWPSIGCQACISIAGFVAFTSQVVVSAIKKGKLSETLSGLGGEEFIRSLAATLLTPAYS